MRKLEWQEVRTIIKAIGFLLVAGIISLFLNSCTAEEDIDMRVKTNNNTCSEVIEYSGTWDGDLILTDNLCIDGILSIPGNLYTAGYDLSFTGNLTIQGNIYLGGGESVLEHNGESLIFEQIIGFGTLNYCPDSTVTQTGDLFPNSINVINNCQ